VGLKVYDDRKAPYIASQTSDQLQRPKAADVEVGDPALRLRWVQNGQCGVNICAVSYRARCTESATLGDTSFYEPGKRSGAWQKMRVHQRRDLVIGGNTPGGPNFDAILVGYYKGRSWIFVGKVRAGFYAGAASVGVQGIPRSRNRSMPL
jgi:hypothetical protein